MFAQLTQHIMYTFAKILYISIYIPLIIGLIKPSLILRWSKKPTRSKIIGYFLLSSIAIALFAKVFTPPTKEEIIISSEDKPVISIEDKPVIPIEDKPVISINKLDYGIFSKKVTGDRKINATVRAYYNADTYQKKNIEKVLLKIINSIENENPDVNNIRIVAFLYSSEASYETSAGVGWIARLHYVLGEQNKFDIDYSDSTISILNSPLPEEYEKLNQLLLTEHNTSICEVNYNLARIFRETLKEADEKYGFTPKHTDFHEKREQEETIKLFKTHNLNDTLKSTIVSYSKYCK